MAEIQLRQLGSAICDLVWTLQPALGLKSSQRTIQAFQARPIKLDAVLPSFTLYKPRWAGEPDGQCPSIAGRAFWVGAYTKSFASTASQDDLVDLILADTQLIAATLCTYSNTECRWTLPNFSGDGISLLKFGVSRLEPLLDTQAEAPDVRAVTGLLEIFADVTFF